MNKFNGKGNLYLYLRWPLWLSLMVLFVTMIVYVIDKNAGAIMLIFTILYVGISIYISSKKFHGLKLAMQKAVENQAKLQGIYFAKIDVPHAIISTDGKILWANDNFLAISKSIAVGKKISDLFVDLNKTVLENIKNEKIDYLTTYGDKKYRLSLRQVELNKIEEKKAIKLFDDNDKIIMVYVFDETEYYTLRQLYDNEKQVTGFIYIDNFDEVAENMEDSKASMLIAMVDRKLTRYVSYNSGIIKKLEKDKYFFVTTKKDIEDMIEDRFTILEQTKEIIGGDNIPLTLSIGVGYGGKSIEANHDYARIAMDMALGRGGDQAVVKKGNKTFYFGGKSASTTSNARVRARVKATSFRETLDTKDKVLIVGHVNGDFDSFGASIGVYIMAKHLGKEVHIVINSLTNAVKDMKNKFVENTAYDKLMFITGNEAVNLVDDNTLIIFVDHNNPKITDEPRLTSIGGNFVVFDHHRVSNDSITDTILRYIEPSASSTCELIIEIMMYFDDDLKMKPLDADVMLGGIMIDTLSFSYQTSSKTFDAASFLKKRGADSDRVRKILRIDYNSEMVKNEVIRNVEFYKENYAIAVLEDTDGVEANVVKAEIANELISIKGVKASIVITMSNGKYSISSRSIDDMNVQVLMEKFGGGGHRSQAGAMIEALSFEDAKNKIKAEIDKLLIEEEIRK